MNYRFIYEHQCSYVNVRHNPISEFEANFHAVIDNYLSACVKLDEVEESIRPNLMLNIAPTVYAAMLKTAARNGVSLQQWAEQVLKTAVN